jgi:hypothetical protein
MSNRKLDEYLAHEHHVGEVACVECGFHRDGAHHPGIKCPKTGRCGECGNAWPCEEHKRARPGKDAAVAKLRGFKARDLGPLDGTHVVRDESERK